MTAKNLTLTFSITYGTDDELKKVRGKTHSLEIVNEMICNEVEAKIKSQIPEDKKAVLTISYSQQKIRGPHKDRKPKKKKDYIGDV